MQFRNIFSLSRLLDVYLNIEVIEGKPTNLDNLLSITISVPTEEWRKMTGDEVETLYLRPMVKALAEKINALGNVKTAKIPLSRFPKTEQAWGCTKGKIPVLLRVVRRVSPYDRHQILIHALVQPESQSVS